MNPAPQNAPRRGKPARWLLAVLALGLAAAALALWVRGHKPASPAVAPAGQQAAAGLQAPQPTTAARPAAHPGGPGAALGSQVFKDQLAVLTNAVLALSERRKVAEALARDGSEAALATLKLAFASGPEDLRAVIAESLGQCANPEGAKWLQALLQDPNALVARGAVRGLSTQDTPEAAAALVRLLGEANADPELRIEVASGLGAMAQPGVTQALADALRTTEDPDFAQAALSALGQRDFKETEAFFKEYLQTPGISSELRVEAVEALAQAQGDPSALLLSMAADPDAEVRAAAAWALSATDGTGNVGAQVLDLLGKETDPDVRLRLYQALRNQEGVDGNAALALVEKETNPSARVAGLDLLATLLRENPTAPLQNFFKSTGVAELKQIALTSQNYDDRQLAIIALTRARTPEAMMALNELASQLKGQIAPVSVPPVQPKR